MFVDAKKFLLTHPSRGATTKSAGSTGIIRISTHTPLTGCNSISGSTWYPVSISTHTPLTGCNYKSNPLMLVCEDFYSHTPHGVQLNFPSATVKFFSFLLTHPSRGATSISGSTWYPVSISTHTPLTGCNAQISRDYNLQRNFYSHTPHGVQLIEKYTWLKCNTFLLTHPSRGATSTR